MVRERVPESVRMPLEIAVAGAIVGFVVGLGYPPGEIVALVTGILGGIV